MLLMPQRDQRNLSVEETLKITLLKDSEIDRSIQPDWNVTDISPRSISVQLAFEDPLMI